MKHPGKTIHFRVSTGRQKGDERSHSNGNSPSVSENDQRMEVVSGRNDGIGTKQTRTHFCIKSILLQYASKPENDMVSKRQNNTSRGKGKGTHELQAE